jgi:hypothetical protein
MFLNKDQYIPKTKDESLDQQLENINKEEIVKYNKRHKELSESSTLKNISESPRNMLMQFNPDKINKYYPNDERRESEIKIYSNITTELPLKNIWQSSEMKSLIRLNMKSPTLISYTISPYKIQYIHYYENGSAKLVQNIRNGKIDGEQIIYNKKNRIKRIDEYENGIIRKTTKYKNDVKKSITYYHNGAKIVNYYDSKGNIIENKLSTVCIIL